MGLAALFQSASLRAYAPAQSPLDEATCAWQLGKHGAGSIKTGASGTEREPTPRARIVKTHTIRPGGRTRTSQRGTQVLRRRVGSRASSDA